MSWLSRLFSPPPPAPPATCAGCEARTEEARWLRGRIESLEHQVATMRREGFEPMRAEALDPQPEGRGQLPPAVEEAVVSMAGGDRAEEARLWEYAQGLLEKKMPAEDLADRIYRGGDPIMHVVKTQAQEG